MSPRLVNVRLDDERARKVRELQEQGVSLSDVVREAIDQRYAVLNTPVDEDVETIMSRIYARYPTPPDAPVRDYDVHDRHAAAEAIRRKLRSRRS